MALSDDQLFQQYRDRIKADPLNRYVINWDEVFRQSYDVGRKLTEWTNSQEYSALIEEAERRKAANNFQPVDPSTTTSQPDITTSQPSERPDVYEVYQVSSGGAGPNKLVAVRVGDARPQNVVQYLGQKKRTDTVPYMQQNVSVNDIVNGTIPGIAGGGADSVARENQGAPEPPASPPVYTEYGGADQQSERVEEEKEVSPPVYQPYGGADQQPDIDQEQLLDVKKYITQLAQANNIEDPEQLFNEFISEYGTDFSSYDYISSGLEFVRSRNSGVGGGGSGEGGGDEESGGEVNIGEIWNSVNQDLQNQYGQYFSPDELTQLFFEFGDGFSEGGRDLNSQISQFLNEKYYAKSIEVDDDDAERLAFEAAEKKRIEEDALLEAYINALRKDPLSTSIVNWSTLSSSNPNVAQRLTEWTNSQEYFDLVNAAEGRGGDGTGDEAGDEAGDGTGDDTSNLEVLRNLLRNQDYINRVKQHFSEGGNRDNVSAVIDSILSELNISDNQKADLKADLSYFLSNEAESQLAVENLEKDDTEVVDEVEGEVVDEVEGEVEDDGDSVVVVTDPAGNDVEPNNDENDINEFVNEILSIIGDTDFSDLDDLENVKKSLVNVFEKYKGPVSALADIQSAKNIIDGHIDTILNNALEQSSNLFSIFTEEETFGRDPRSGLEVSMENIITQLEIDKQVLLTKQSDLVNMRYDQALERLARKGLLEGGGISASGTNILAATDIEQQRAQDLIQKELELDEKLRVELRETLKLLDTISRSRTDEAIAQQQSRLDTTQQLLDFVVELENLRLGERRVVVEERGMTLDEYRSSVDEKIRTAELTGNLNGEETLALREMFSRIEIEERRLDLETRLADSSISVQEKEIALLELVELQKVQLEAKRYNLEEALGLRGLSLQERRLVLDEFLAEAGVEQAERELALDQLLGEGDLAIRRDLADLEGERITADTFIAERRLLLEQQALDIEAGEIDQRYAMEERRLALDNFIASNRIALEQNAQRIEESLGIAGFELEESLGLARLQLEGERLDIEDRRQIAEALSTERRLDIEQQQLLMEEMFFNKEMSLSEREFMLRNHLETRNLTFKDRELVVKELLAEGEREALDFEQEMRLAEITGFIIDPVTGHPVPTFEAQAAKDDKMLRQAGLDIEADAIKNANNQFYARLYQEANEFQMQYGLDKEESKAMVAKIYADIESERKRVRNEIKRLQNDILFDWKELGLRTGELDLAREQVTNEKELADARLKHEVNVLEAQVHQQNLDRAMERLHHAQKLKLSRDEFNDFTTQRDKEWLFTTEEAARQYDLDQDELAVLRYQVEQDVRLRGMDQIISSGQWAREFGLKEDEVRMALEFAERTMDDRVRAVLLENNYTEVQIDAIERELEAFEDSEARRDEMWEKVVNGDLMKTKEGRRQLSAMMAIVNEGGWNWNQGGKGGGGSGDRGVVSTLSSIFTQRGANDLYNWATGQGGGDDDDDGDGGDRDEDSDLPLSLPVLAWLADKKDKILPFLEKGKDYLPTLLPYLGHAAAIAAIATWTYKVGSNVYSQLSGKRTDEWVRRQWLLPQQYASNFIPDINDPNLSEVERKIAEAGNVGEGIRGELIASISFETGSVVWTRVGEVSGTIVAREDAVDFMRRTNKFFMPIELFQEIAVATDDDRSVKEIYDLDFNPSYAWIGGSDVRGQREMGIFFAGSRNEKGNFKNMQYIPMDEDEVAKMDALFSGEEEEEEVVVEEVVEEEEEEEFVRTEDPDYLETLGS